MTGWASVAVALVVALAGSPESGDGATFARETAAAYAAQMRGFETFVVTTTYDMRGGPFRRSGSSVSAYAEAGGIPVRHRVLRNIENGRSDDAPALAARSAERDGPLSHFGLRLPYLTAVVGDYRFGAPRETPSTVELDFTTTVKDEAHGDGTLSYDRLGNRIDRVTFHPAVLPAHATSTLVTVDFGRTLDERWDIVKITREGTGRAGPITGRGTSVSVYERYRAYPSEAAAVSALDAMTPPSP